MSGCVTDVKRRRLVRIETEPKSKSKSEPELKEMEKEIPLNHIFYPRRST